MKSRFYRLLFLFIFVMIIMILTSCGESKEKEPVVYKFKIEEKVCIMGNFNGVVIDTWTINSGSPLYRVDYITKYGTKVDNYYEYQLSAGYCNTTLPVPDSEEESSEEETSF